MMMVGAVLLFTADRSCCWLPAGNDGAWAERPPRLWQGPPNRLHKRGLDAVWVGKRVWVLICGSAAGYITPTPHRRRQPNPHNAR